MNSVLPSIICVQVLPVTSSLTHVVDVVIVYLWSQKQTEVERTPDGDIHIHTHTELTRTLSSSTSLSSILDDGGLQSVDLIHRKKKNFFTVCIDLKLLYFLLLFYSVSNSMIRNHLIYDMKIGQLFIALVTTLACREYTFFHFFYDLMRSRCEYTFDITESVGEIETRFTQSTKIR